MESLAFILLMAGEGGSPMMNLLFFAAIIVVMYFFMIRPQTKKAKKQKQFIQKVKKGDKIVTNGGIHGKIIKEQEKTFLIETEGKNRLKIDRSAVSLDNTSAHYGENDKKKSSKKKK